MLPGSLQQHLLVFLAPFWPPLLAASLIFSKCLSDTLIFIHKVFCPYMKIHDMALSCLTLGGVFSFSHAGLLSVPQTDQILPTSGPLHMPLLCHSLCPFIMWPVAFSRLLWLLPKIGMLLLFSTHPLAFYKRMTFNKTYFLFVSYLVFLSPLGLRWHEGRAISALFTSAILVLSTK